MSMSAAVASWPHLEALIASAPSAQPMVHLQALTEGVNLTPSCTAGESPTTTRGRENDHSVHGALSVEAGIRHVFDVLRFHLNQLNEYGEAKFSNGIALVLHGRLPWVEQAAWRNQFSECQIVKATNKSIMCSALMTLTQQQSSPATVAATTHQSTESVAAGDVSSGARLDDDVYPSPTGATLGNNIEYFNSVDHIVTRADVILGGNQLLTVVVDLEAEVMRVLEDRHRSKYLTAATLAYEASYEASAATSSLRINNNGVATSSNSSSPLFPELPLRELPLTVVVEALVVILTQLGDWLGWNEPVKSPSASAPSTSTENAASMLPEEEQQDVLSHPWPHAYGILICAGRSTTFLRFLLSLVGGNTDSSGPLKSLYAALDRMSLLSSSVALLDASGIQVSSRSIPPTDSRRRSSMSSLERWFIPISDTHDEAPSATSTAAWLHAQMTASRLRDGTGTAHPHAGTHLSSTQMAPGGRRHFLSRPTVPSGLPRHRNATAPPSSASLPSAAVEWWRRWNDSVLKPAVKKYDAALSDGAALGWILPALGRYGGVEATKVGMRCRDLSVHLYILEDASVVPTRDAQGRPHRAVESGCICYQAHGAAEAGSLEHEYCLRSGFTSTTIRMALKRSTPQGTPTSAASSSSGTAARQAFRASYWEEGVAWLHRYLSTVVQANTTAFMLPANTVKVSSWLPIDSAAQEEDDTIAVAWVQIGLPPNSVVPNLPPSDHTGAREKGFAQQVNSFARAWLDLGHSMAAQWAWSSLKAEGGDLLRTLIVTPPSTSSSSSSASYLTVDWSRALKWPATKSETGPEALTDATLLEFVVVLDPFVPLFATASSPSAAPSNGPAKEEVARLEKIQEEFVHAFNDGCLEGAPGVPHSHPDGHPYVAPGSWLRASVQLLSSEDGQRLSPKHRTTLTTPTSLRSNHTPFAFPVAPPTWVKWGVKITFHHPDPGSLPSTALWSSSHPNPATIWERALHHIRRSLKLVDDRSPTCAAMQDILTVRAIEAAQKVLRGEMSVPKGRVQASSSSPTATTPSTAGAAARTGTAPAPPRAKFDADTFDPDMEEIIAEARAAKGLTAPASTTGTDPAATAAPDTGSEVSLKFDLMTSMMTLRS